jgi:hypothetical protein
MTAMSQLDANRANAKRSTGPRGETGKAVAAKNAVKHGLRATSPVVSGEKAGEWDTFQSSVHASLNPVGSLEDELADRVAALFWRLRRVVRYESAVTSSGIDRAINNLHWHDDDPEAPQDPEELLAMLKAGINPRPRSAGTVERELVKARGDLETTKWLSAYLPTLTAQPKNDPITGEQAYDVFFAVIEILPTAPHDQDLTDEPRFLHSVGIPEEWQDDPVAWSGWTVGAVLVGVRWLVDKFKVELSDRLDRATRQAERESVRNKTTVEELESELGRFKKRQRRVEAAARGRVLLPDADEIDKLTRYEAHLGRALQQTLVQLERFQALRMGIPVLPPAVAEIGVSHVIRETAE